MSYAIMLLWEKALSEQVLDCWKTLEELGYGHMSRSGFAPHVTLAGVPKLYKEYQTVLEEIAHRYLPLHLSCSSLSFFPGDKLTLFLGTALDANLLSLHLDLCNSLSNLGIQLSHYYKPNIWVPHTTLEMGLELKDIPQATALCLQHLNFPLSGVLDSISIVEVPGGRVVRAEQLEGIV